MSDRIASVAMVLAAGRGIRMQPLSDTLPKPALPLPEGPLVESALRQAVALGIRRVVINVWHLPQLMTRAVRGIPLPELEIQLSPEPELMGTAGGLALARDRGLLGAHGPVVVLNGDSLLKLSLGPLLERFATSLDLVTLALLPHPDPARWSRVELDRSGIVTSIVPREQPHTLEAALLYPGAMMVSREALDGLSTEPQSAPEALWEPARAVGRLGGARVTGSWREVGTPSDYRDAALWQLAGRTVLDPSAWVPDRAGIRASYLGPHALAGTGSVITDSVLACGARVGKDARVTRSVLLGPVEVADGGTVIDEFRAAPLTSVG